jgi:hypothetical protein
MPTATTERMTAIATELAEDGRYTMASLARTVISDPKRDAAYEPLYEIDPETGESVEIFFADRAVAKSFGTQPGWFWWARQSGRLPERPPTGPFATSYAAYRNALDGGNRLFVKEALYEQSLGRGA